MASKIETPLKSPLDYVGQVARSNEYLRQRGEGIPSFNALGNAAANLIEIAERENEGHLSFDERALNIIAAIPDFIEAQRALDNLREIADSGERCVRRSEKEPHLRKVIAFNHAIRTCVDGSPHLTPSDIIKFVGQSTFVMDQSKSKDTATYAMQECRQIVAGMQSEIFTEWALWGLDGIDNVEPADPDDELRGVDLIATFESGAVLEIDVKTSRVGEQKALENWTQGSPIPFWHGLRADEMGNRFRASAEQEQVILNRLHEVTRIPIASAA